MKTINEKPRLVLLLCSLCFVSSIYLLSCASNSMDLPDEEQNTPPDAFSLIGVTNGALGVDVFPSFSWQAANDKDGDPVTYDLYLDTVENPTTLYAENISGTSFIVTERLTTYTKYYWKVVAKDTKEGAVSSTIYNFNTRGLNFGSTPVTTSASFSRRARHTSVAFQDKLWVIGGYDDVTKRESNDVWVSNDGSNWSKVSQTIPFSARLSHTTVVFDNKLWVIGGVSSNVDTNDVWWSNDGRSWNQLTQAAPFSKRSAHTSVVFKNKIWVIAGSFNGVIKNDVWSSSDGSNWTQVTSGAPFPVRIEHTSVVFNDGIWVIGGSAGQAKNDIWFSTDGLFWAQATTVTPFPARRGHTSVIFDNKIWVIGGFNNGYFNDFWYSTDGKTWVEATTSAPFSPRFSHTSVVFNNKIWVIAGRDHIFSDPYKNDVWAFD